jgi:hypothetical protein
MRQIKTAGAVLAILLFFYLNIDALCTTLNLRFKPIFAGGESLLPNHWTTRRLFRIWDVFDRWSDFNIGFRAYGSYSILDSVPAAPTPEMVDLDIDSYFPYHRGETNRRLWMVTIRHDLPRTRKYQQRVLATIKRLHNQAHPEKPIKQAFLYHYTWQKSPLGWEVNMDSGTIALEAVE